VAIEHAINLLGLFGLPIVVLYARYASAAPITAAHAAWWLPAAGYVALIGARAVVDDTTRVPFAWLAPLVCGFTAAAALTLWRHRAHRREVVIPAESVVAFAALLNLAQLVRMEFGHIAIIRAIVPMVMSLGFVAIAVFATRSTFAKAAAGKRYERSGLDELSARQLLARIDGSLRGDRLYRRVDLTLAHLAAAVGATPHQVSEALNHYAGSSFTDVVARMRVDDVKAQLRDPVNDLFTIEGIGLSAGFGSRSAIYSAFRRLEDVTPTEFRSRERKLRG
jgi:AraC-like DNA-binding protein